MFFHLIALLLLLLTHPHPHPDIWIYWSGWAFPLLFKFHILVSYAYIAGKIKNICLSSLSACWSYSPLSLLSPYIYILYKKSHIYCAHSALQDVIYQVRVRFANRLHKGLISLKLPLEYMAILCLGANDPLKERRQQLKLFLTLNINKRREYIKQNPSARGKWCFVCVAHGTILLCINISQNYQSELSKHFLFCLFGNVIINNSIVFKLFWVCH